MATYLVTGGAGFIGSHLADALLAAGHGVRVLDDLSTGRRANLDRRCELVVGDVAEAATARRAMRGVAGCFHLAAIASVARANEDWAGTHRANQTGAVQVLDAARFEGGVKVVYASSAAVYGDQGPGMAREEARTAPLTAYGTDKLGCELHAAVAHRVHGVPSCGMRFFNVYGPRQDPSSPYSGVISIFCRRLVEGEPVTLHGDGGQTRDFVFVADVVRALLAAMARAPAGAELFNVCTGRGTEIRHLATAIADLLGVRAAVVHGPARPGDIRHSVGHGGRAERSLGFRPGIPLRQGLAETLGAAAPSPARDAARGGPPAARRGGERRAGMAPPQA